MLVTIGTKVSPDRRDQFYALAASLNTSPAALMRDLVDRCIEGDDNLYGLLKGIGEDLTRILVLARFLAEQVDADVTQDLLNDTEAFLIDARENGAFVHREAGHG